MSFELRDVNRPVWSADSQLVAGHSQFRVSGKISEMMIAAYARH